MKAQGKKQASKKEVKKQSAKGAKVTSKVKKGRPKKDEVDNDIRILSLEEQLAEEYRAKELARRRKLQLKALMSMLEHGEARITKVVGIPRKYIAKIL